MSPKECKKLHFGFFYIILAPICFDQEAEEKVVVDTSQLWIWEAVSPKIKCPYPVKLHNF